MTLPRLRTLIVAPAALAATLALAPAVAAQASRTPPPTGDQPQGADLFSPVGTAFDMTPAQEKAMAAFRADPSAGEIQVLRINANVPRTADAVNFNFLTGTPFMLSTKARQDRAAGSYAWLGGDESGGKSATLVVQGDAITGTIRDGDKLFRVRPLGGGVHAVIAVDQAKLPPEHPPAFDRRKVEPKEPPPLYSRRLRASAVRPTAAAESETAGTSGAGLRASTRAASERTPRADLAGAAASADLADAPPAAADAACGTIDVLVAYTPAAESESGGAGALAQLAIDETNQSYLKSGIQPRLRLVHAEEVAYVESGDMELDVERLANPADGFLDDVPPLRDAHHADLAVLLTGNGNFCGIAADILAAADRAFAVVGQNCATGYYSFGHELGHLQGARHNPEADPTPTPFAHGHGFFSTANRKRTVMSYDCPVGCTRIDVWADPTVVVDGVPMGDPAVHHDARVLNETACDIAAFRTGPGSEPGSGPATPESTVAPKKVPSLSAWSALLLVAAAPWALARRARA
jgi:hypothetical protein